MRMPFRKPDHCPNITATSVEEMLQQQGIQETCWKCPTMRSIAQLVLRNAGLKRSGHGDRLADLLVRQGCQAMQGFHNNCPGYDACPLPGATSLPQNGCNSPSLTHRPQVNFPAEITQSV